LRNLAAIWLPSDYVSGFFLASAGTAPWWQHVLILLGMTAVFLTAAALVLRRRQLITAPEV
jgi:F0F1-type ATP synthase assembly protein I